MGILVIIYNTLLLCSNVQEHSNGVTENDETYVYNTRRQFHDIWSNLKNWFQILQWLQIQCISWFYYKKSVSWMRNIVIVQHFVSMLARCEMEHIYWANEVNFGSVWIANVLTFSIFVVVSLFCFCWFDIFLREGSLFKSSRYPGTFFVDRMASNSQRSPASAPQVLGLNVCTNISQLI